MIKCGLSDKCGGCNLLHLSYKETLEQKTKYVQDCFRKEGIKATINNIYGAENDGIKYRNKMIVGFKTQNGKTICGFYEENSHRIIELDKCIMHSDAMNKVFNSIKNAVIKLKLRPYDEDRRIGLIRYALIREAVVTKEILVTIVTSSDFFPSRSEFVKTLRSENPNIKTIIQNVNPRKTSIVLGEKEQVLYGDGFITDCLCGLKFNISSKSFYQVNPKQAEVLYGLVKKALLSDENNDVVIDAYSGIGTIGLSLHDVTKEIYSVENNPVSHKAALTNAKMNKIKNVYFENQDATLYLNDLAKNNEKVDAIILDPPRTGSTVEFLNSCIKLKPKKIVYVSCGPDTLARDLKVLLKEYVIKSVNLVDMFCYTTHVESVCLLTNRAGNTKNKN